MSWYDPDEIKAANPIEEVARELLEKPKRNPRSKYWCCPNGEGHTKGYDEDGHLQIYPDEGKCYCHRCNWGGTVIDLVMKVKNCSFKMACAYLAWRAGVEKRVYEDRKWKRKSESKAKDTDFSKFWDCIVDYGYVRNLSGTDLKVYLVYLRHASKRGRMTYVPRHTVALEAGISERTVSRATKKLIDRGLLERTYIKQPNGKITRVIKIVHSEDIVPPFPELNSKGQINGTYYKSYGTV